jgi:hypothetical protein
MGYEIHWAGEKLSLQGHFMFNREDGQTTVRANDLDVFEMGVNLMGNRVTTITDKPIFFKYEIGDTVFNLLGYYGLPVSVRPMEMEIPQSETVSLSEPAGLAIIFAGLAALGLGVRRRIRA